MAPSRALTPLYSICAYCARQQIRKGRLYTNSHSLHAETSTSSLPRVATPSFWASLIPKPFRRSPAGTEVAAVKPKSKEWNPYTPFIILGILVGSNAIQMIALRNEMNNFSRKTDAKLELLREVVQKVKNGEEVDVRRALGTGDPKAEEEWEEVIKELESTDMLLEGRKKREAKRAAKAAAREGSATTEQAEEKRKVEGAKDGRPKFMM